MSANGASGESLGKQLREARETVDLTQAELAARFDVSTNTIGLWESGQTPRAKHRRAIREFIRFVNGETGEVVFKEGVA